MLPDAIISGIEKLIPKSPSWTAPAKTIKGYLTVEGSGQKLKNFFKRAFDYIDLHTLTIDAYPDVGIFEKGDFTEIVVDKVADNMSEPILKERIRKDDGWRAIMHKAVSFFFLSFHLCLN